MLSNHIEDLITAAKAKPNSIWRNKGISRLQDALAAFKMDEMGNATVLPAEALKSAVNAQPGHVLAGPSLCTCSPGMVNTMCRVHGKDLLNPQPRVQ